MLQFQNVLVGVDLSQTFPPGSNNFSAPVSEAIETAVGLAAKTQAEITFFSAMELPEDGPYMDLVGNDLSELSRRWTEPAYEILGALTRDVRARGISARCEVVTGTAWVEIIREVQRHGHDLVIVGTRDSKGLERFLLGSTAKKLLRYCPSSVWVTRPGCSRQLSQILVASDLSAVSEKALQAAAALAPLWHARIRLLHGAVNPLERVWFNFADKQQREQYRQRIHADARHVLRSQAARLGPVADAVEIEVVDAPRGADSAILNYLDEHDIDMLMMGTVGRGGLPGVLVGNTAERLLHEVSCSLLAVKPDGFRCPALPESKNKAEPVASS